MNRMAYGRHTADIERSERGEQTPSVGWFETSVKKGAERSLSGKPRMRE